MLSPIPEVLANYNVYDENDRLIGVAGEVTLPNLTPLTETIGHAGLAGEYETVVPGHFGSLTLEIPFSAIMDYNTKLLNMDGRRLYLRASQQSYDSALGKVRHRPLRVVVGYLPKGIDLGKAAKGKSTETKVTVEILYLKVEESGQVLIELDKLNFVYIVNGDDKLAVIRSQI
jgi:P2 family phage contractile tail tube protein